MRIKAAGINPLDTKIRAGIAAHAQARLPAILGIDLAGVVEAVGSEVTAFKPGDEVYGMTGGIGGVPGSLVEYAAVDADLLALKPRNLSMRQATALPLVFVTAWEGLVGRANVRAGQKVLIHGGGVGHVAVQLAKARGAEVFATEGEGFDIVYDTVGGLILDASFDAARRYHGHVVSSLGRGTHKLAPLSFRGATYSGVFNLLPLLTGKGRAHHGEIMREATRLVEAGKLAPLLDERRFTLETGQDAHTAVEDGFARGKIVADIAD